MLRLLTLGSLLVALCCAGCDTSVYDDANDPPPCATTPQPSEASYFPHEVGQTWQYDYRKDYSSPNSAWDQHTEGVLSWEVKSANVQCAEAYLLLSETFEGVQTNTHYQPEAGLDTSFAVAWEKELFARLEGDRLVIEEYIGNGTYTMDPVRWIYPIDTTATVAYDFTTFCGFGGCIHATLELERGVGIAKWGHLNGGAGHFRETRTLTLRR